MEKKDGIEIITQGEFTDCGYRVKTIVIRLIDELFQEELDSHEWNDRCCYETDEEWKEYRKEKIEKRKRLEEKVRSLLALTDSQSFVLSQSLSEIYTVVAMYEKEEQKDKEEIIHDDE